MKYKLIVNQGQGCDYTIGCGIADWDIVAVDAEAAREQAVAMLREHYLGEETPEYYRWNDEQDLVSATLVGVVEELPLESMRSLWHAEMVQAERGKKEAAEREQLAKLKAKYG